MTKVSSKLSQTAINLKVCAQQTNAMQKIFLARSEVEFFGSEVSNSTDCGILHNISRLNERTFTNILV